MDSYSEIFNIADYSDSEISEVLKDVETEELKDLDNQLKKEFKEKEYFFDGLTKEEEELIGMQIVSQYLRLISLIGLELLEREN